MSNLYNPLTYKKLEPSLKTQNARRDQALKRKLRNIKLASMWLVNERTELLELQLQNKELPTNSTAATFLQKAEEHKALALKQLQEAIMLIEAAHTSVFYAKLEANHYERADNHGR